MSITYNTGIPDAPNNPSNDQPLMKVNTDAIDTFVAVDHVGFNVQGMTSGYHNKSTYVTQGTSNPGNVSGAAQVYSKTITYSGLPAGSDVELFLKKANDDSNNPNSVIQLTNTRFGANASSSGYSWLPGGIIIQWKKSVATFDPTGPAGFPVSFPITFPTSVYSCTVSFIKDANSAKTCNFKSQVTTSGFTLRGNDTFDGYYFIAIGA